MKCIGWVHSHPGHDNFLSSADQHVTFRFQQVLSYAIAIVVDGFDYSEETLLQHVRIYTLSEHGMNTVMQCNERERKLKEEHIAGYVPMKSIHGGHPHNHAVRARHSDILGSESPVPAILIRDFRPRSIDIDPSETEDADIDLPEENGRSLIFFSVFGSRFSFVYFAHVDEFLV